MTVSVEVKDEAGLALVETAMVPIRDALLTHLSSMNVDTVTGPDNRAKLQAKMLTLANTAAGDSKLVKRVFFTEFVIQ
jgi:flagellar basal body-associated protein FliL